MAMVFLLTAGTSVLASPDQLDVLGLIPGVSDLSQVKQVSVDGTRPNESGEGEEFLLEVGGYIFSYTGLFRNEKLDSLACRPRGSGDIDAHLVLLVGFTKKFGKFRVEKGDRLKGYRFDVSFWTDRRGNSFSIFYDYSPSSPSFAGFVMRSGELNAEAERKNAEAKRKAEEREARRKF